MVIAKEGNKASMGQQPMESGTQPGLQEISRVNDATLATNERGSQLASRLNGTLRLRQAPVHCFPDGGYCIT